MAETSKITESRANIANMSETCYCLCVTQWHVTRLLRKARVVAIFCGKANSLVLLKKNFAHDLEYLKQILDRKTEWKDEVVICGNVLLFKDIKISLGLLITAREMQGLFREITTSRCQ